TMDEMVIMTRSVSRGSQRAMVVGDMPFMSYQVSKEEAVRNAGRLIQEAGAQAVKLEVGADDALSVEAVVKAGIPVMGHMGVTHGVVGFTLEELDRPKAAYGPVARSLFEAAEKFSQDVRSGKPVRSKRDQ